VFEDTKGIIIICKSNKERQHKGQRKKDKRTNNDPLNIHIKHTHKTKDRLTRTALKLKLLLLVTGKQTVKSASKLSLSCAPGHP
jgi:hypothetical protein